MDPFFDGVNYGKPVVFLRDVISGEFAKVKNDDTFGEEQARSYYNITAGELSSKVFKPIRERKAESSCSKYRKTPRMLPIPFGRTWMLISEMRSRSRYRITPRQLLIPYGRPRTLLIPEMGKEEEDFVKKLAILAIKRYNRMEGGDYKVLRMINCNYLRCHPVTEYYLTFVAAAATTDDEKIFQAMVKCSIIHRKCCYRCVRKVEVCRLEPEESPSDEKESGDSVDSCADCGQHALPWPFA